MSLPRNGLIFFRGNVLEPPRVGIIARTFTAAIC